MPIDRRHLLMAALPVAAVAPWLAATSRPAAAGASPPADLCSADGRPPPAWRRIAAGAAPRLRYEGTHILTFGAMRALAESFNASSPAKPLQVHGGGCDDALNAVMRDEAELGGLCCPATSTPARRWLRVPVALDLKAVVAHPSVTLDALTLPQLRSIASGGARRWSELGGADRPIALVLRQHCPEFREPVREALLGPARETWPGHPILVERDEQIVQTVARFAGAVGVVSLVFAREEAAAGRIRLLALNGVRPQPAAPPPRDFPLMGPLELVMKRPTPAIRAFLRHVDSPAGRATLAREFVPLPLAGWLRDAPDRA